MAVGLDLRGQGDPLRRAELHAKNALASSPPLKAAPRLEPLAPALSPELPRVRGLRALDTPELEVRRLEKDLLFDEPPGDRPLERLRKASGLRILWWNIEHGQTNEQI